MKTNKILSIVMFLLLLASNANTLTAQCSTCTSQYPSSTQSISAGVSNQTISSCTYGGEYAVCSVVSGSTYTWSTCGNSAFDTQITVRANSGNCSGTVYGYNDDNCGLQSQVTWTATFTGTVRVIVNKYNCTTQSSCMTLTWSRSAAAPQPCNSISSLSCGTTSSFSLATGNGAWNSLGGPYSTPGNEKVFSFTPTITGPHSIDVTSNSSYVDLYYKSGSCGSSSWSYVDDIYTSATNTLNLTAGTTYHFLIDDENTSASSGTIKINCPTPCAYNSVNISVTGGTYPSEVSWNLTNSSGTVVASGGANSNQNLCLPTGCYTMNMFDSYGDGWNGATYTLSFNGSAISTGTLTSGSSNSVGYIGVNQVCTPPSPCDFATSISSCGTSTNYTISSGAGQWNNLGGPYSTPGNESILSFTPSVTASYPITVTSNYTYVDLFYKTGTCGNSGWTYVDDIYSSATNSLNLTAGTTYYFLLDGESTNSNNGSITIDCPCIGAALDGTYSGEFSMSGTTAGACNDNALRSSQDRTYEWNVTCAGNYTVSLCGSSYDTYLYLTSSNGSGIIATNDDYCSLQSQVSTYLSAGTYYITVEGFSETSNGAFILTTSGTTNPSVSGQSVSTTCNGSSDGSITASAIGGCDMMYAINGGNYQSSNQFTGLTAGTYTITAMNSFGNTASTSVTVSEPSPIVVNLTSTNPNGTACSGGSVNLTANVSGGSGTMNYTWHYYNANTGFWMPIYSWTGSDVTPFTDVNSASPSQTRDYRITVSNAQNASCTASAVMTVTIIPDPVITITSTNVTCNGDNDGTATATISGGLPLNYGFNWYSDDNISSNNNPSGDGTLSVTGLFPSDWVINTTASPSYGCYASASVTITEPEVLVANSTASAILCNGDLSTIEVSAEGGTAPYDGVGTFQELAGNYSYTITDANGCTTSTSVAISQPSAINVNAGQDGIVYYGYQPMACYSTTGSANGGTPGYSYNWSNGQVGTTLADCPTQSTTYTLTVTDANGCTQSDEVDICVVDVRCQVGNSNIYKVEMCQTPPGNPGNAHTICVDESAVPAHLAIGCTLGACDEQNACTTALAAKSLNQETIPSFNQVLISISPNPTNTKSKVSLTLQNKGDYSLEIIDLHGKTIDKYTIGEINSSNQIDVDVDLSNFESGMYLIGIKKGGVIIETSRIVKN